MIARLPRVAFLAGCIAAVLTASAHVAAHLGPEPVPANDAERAMREAARTVALEGIRRFGSERTLAQIHTGFSWHFAASIALAGLTGLALRHAAPNDPRVFLAGAKAGTAFFGAGLVISLTYFFAIPTALLGAAFVCFALAAATARPRKGCPAPSPVASGLLPQE